MFRFCGWVLAMMMAAILSSCSSSEDSLSFCENLGSFSPEFRIFCPTQESNYFIPQRYGCLAHGGRISPPISWAGVPEGATHLKIALVDGSCVHQCGVGCTFHHWVLDIPLSEMTEIKEGEALNPAYVLPNGDGHRAYAPVCPPLVGQIQAFVLKAIAYRMEGSKPVVLGRAQSTPLLYAHPTD